MQLIAGSERKIRPNFVKKISPKFYTENLLTKKKSFKIVSLLQEIQLMNLVKLEIFYFSTNPCLVNKPLLAMHREIQILLPPAFPIPSSLQLSILTGRKIHYYLLLH